MTREDTKVILEILKAGYPIFYKNMDKKQMTNIANLWSEMFEDDDVNIVKVAVKELIQIKTDFPPSIADIKQKMYSLITETKTPAEFWNELLKAIRNGNYGAEEEFKKLSDEVKTFVGSPSQLKELASMNSDVINSVTKGQFLKQIENIQARMKEEKQMLPEAKKIKELALCVGQDVNLVLGEVNEQIKSM